MNGALFPQNNESYGPLGQERPGFVSLERNQQPISTRVNVASANSFQAINTQRTTGLANRGVNNPLTISLDTLLRFFQQHRINDKKDLEVHVSNSILLMINIENFGYIVKFLKCQLQNNSRKPINSTILLGLARFAWRTIVKYELYKYEVSSKSLAGNVNLLSFFEFFTNNKELFPKLVVNFGFGVEPLYITLEFISFFNNSFSNFVQQLTINTDTDDFPQVLKQLSICPKLKTINLILKIGIPVDSFGCNISLLKGLIIDKLIRFEGIVDKFPNLSAIEMCIGVNFKDVPFEQDDQVLMYTQNVIDSYFNEDPIKLPFTINDSSIFIYPCSYR